MSINHPKKAPRKNDQAFLVTLTTEARLLKDNNGDFYGPSSIGGDTQWRKYARPGWKLRLLARAGDASDINAKSTLDPISTAQVMPLPRFQGLAGLFLRLVPTLRAVSREARQTDLMVLRIPGVVSTVAGLCAIIVRRPYVAEVVGDIETVLQSSARPAVRALAKPATSLTRLIVAKARAVRYITFDVLQNAYPTRAEKFAISNVQLPPDMFATAPKSRDPGQESVRLLAVGSQEFPYKGHDTAIRALRLLLDQDVACKLTVIGDGVLNREYRQLVADLGLQQHVDFIQRLAHSAVIERMATADILVHPSLSEGQGRVIIEAMSQGTPVVATRVGGIPEIVRDDALVKPNSPISIAAAIRRIAAPAVYYEHSESALASARRFRKDLLDEQFGLWLDHIAAVGD